MTDSNPAQEDREFAFVILGRIEENLGVPLRHIFEQNAEPNIIRRELRRAIYAATLEKSKLEQPSEEWPNAGQTAHLDALFRSDDTNIVPDIAISEYNLRVVKTYTGSQIHDFVKRVSNGLSLIKEGQSPAVVAAEIIGSGIAAFGLAMIVKTAQELLAGAAFRAALIAGVKAMGGIAVVAGVAALLVVELLLYLILENKKTFLGIVYNNTDLNLKVNDWRSGVEGGSKTSDLYMATGGMNSFMETNENEHLDSPVVQIKKRAFIQSGDPDDNLVMGGIFAAEKNAGFYGTEGVMAFSDAEGIATTRFYLLFACPYTQNNGVFVECGDMTEPAEKAYSLMYNFRALHSESKAPGYSMQARCNSASGGDAAGIAIIEATT